MRQAISVALNKLPVVPPPMVATHVSLVVLFMYPALVAQVVALLGQTGAKLVAVIGQPLLEVQVAKTP